MICPECSGPWLYNWVIRHTNTCSLRLAEDATQNADRERLEAMPWGFARQATGTELALLAASGAAVGGEQVTAVSWEQYRYRVIDGHAKP